MNELPFQQYVYRAHIHRIIDGDTFEADVDLGFNITVRETFRLKDIDTPETFRPRNEAERSHGKQATTEVRVWMDNQDVLIKTWKDSDGKYGRMLADVWHPDMAEWLSEMLVRKELVKLDEYPDDTMEML